MRLAQDGEDRAQRERRHVLVRVAQRSVLLSASFAVLLFIAVKHMAVYFAGSLQPVRLLLASGVADAAALGVIAVAAGAVSHIIETHAQQRIHDVAEKKRDLDSLNAENAAVVQVCQTVALEFAQPLSGVLAYSELLVAQAEFTTDAQRFEVEGLREGALQMQCLLESMRGAISGADAAGANCHVASEVEHAVTQPRPRQCRQARAYHNSHLAPGKEEQR